MSIVTLNNSALRSATAVGTTTALGSMTFIKKLTASSSSTLSFVDGSSSVVLDDTYKEYLFTFNNIHPSAVSVFSFNGSIDTGSNYNVTKTSTYFHASHNESGSAQELALGITAGRLAQSTDFQMLAYNVSTANDECYSGYLHLFNPSSTTFVKHYISNTFGVGVGPGDPYEINSYVAGYFNTTSAIAAVQFKMSSGNMDAGDICLYGIN